MRVDKRLTDMLPKGVLSYALKLPALKDIRRNSLADLGIPESVLEHMALVPKFDGRDTQRALRGSGIDVPPLEAYADRLWDYWERNLDPDLFKDRSFAGAVNGRTVVITGASSGIGRCAAIKIAAAGGIPLLVARSADKLEEVKAEIERKGGTAYVYSADLSDYDSIDACVAQIFADHASVDVLVNNAGRSIRRSVALSYDRFHDYERTIRLNYLGTIRLVLGLLPHMREKQSGHIVNVSSIGVQTNPPRFSAYVASKSALDGFTRVVSSETIGDNVTFTTIHMPLVKHGDDRADEDVRLVPDDLRRRGGRPHLRGHPRQAQADQHPARHLRRGALRDRPEGRRPDPAHGLQGVPGVHGGEGREGAGGAGVGRGHRARVPHARRALVAGQPNRGATAAPRRRSSKCRCGPVEKPVEPTRPIGTPATTQVPGRTAIEDRWPYHDVIPSRCPITTRLP